MLGKLALIGLVTFVATVLVASALWPDPPLAPLFLPYCPEGATVAQFISVDKISEIG